MAQATTTYDRLQAAVNTLSETTGLILRLGYVGNLERWGDDRSWRIWVEGIRDRRNNNLLSMGYGVPTEDLHRMLKMVEQGEVENTVRHAFDRQDLWRFTNVNDIAWDGTKTQVMSAKQVLEAVEAL